MICPICKKVKLLLLIQDLQKMEQQLEEEDYVCGERFTTFERVQFRVNGC